MARWSRSGRPPRPSIPPPQPRSDCLTRGPAAHTAAGPFRVPAVTDAATDPPPARDSPAQSRAVTGSEPDSGGLTASLHSRNRALRSRIGHLARTLASAYTRARSPTRPGATPRDRSVTGRYTASAKRPGADFVPEL